jgi:hypothetical protein
VSYGVLVSKTGQVLVETRSGTGGGASDAALGRFQAAWGAMWVPGRLTLTRLHLTFVPRRAGRGMAMTDINLREVTGIELGGGRITKMISLRTPRHVTRIRCLGAAAVAEQIAELLDAMDREPTAPQP